MSGAQTSTFTNQLYDPLMAGRQQAQTNALAVQQQEISSNEMEQASRAANWVLTQDDKPAAYSTALRLLKANGYAKNSPDQYPGDAAISYLARQGTPSAEQFKVGENRAALAALAPGATPPSTAPTTDGGGGGWTSDNNFGNIRPTGASSGFNTYATPQEGVAAMSSNLAAYASKHGINTLNGLTARWAPKGDGNNDPTAYAASLGKMLGLDPDAPINLGDPLLQSRLIPAMAQIEKGRPFSQPRDVLLAGIQAGLGGAAAPAPTAAPGGGVAARNPGAVQVAGPGAGAPTAPAAPPAAADLMGPRTLPPIGPGSPVVTPQSLANTPAPQNALAPPPPPAAPAVAAPAATPPAALAPPPPPQVALPPRPAIGQDGLQDAQRRELAVLRATGRISPADYIAKQEQMVSHNDTLLQQWQTEARQTVKDAQERQDKATAQAQAAATQQREEATSRREQAKAVDLILEGGDDGSARYAAAYATKAAPIDRPDGGRVIPNMTAYDKPTYRGGKGQTVPEGGPDYTATTVTPPTQMNATQSQAAGFADRVRDALPVITDTSPAAMSRWQILLGKAPVVGNQLVSSEFQQHMQAERNFINATLRRESGMAISESEFVNARQQYIPQPGDGEAVLAQKQKNREQILNTLTREAGPAYKPAEAPASQAAPVTVKTPEEAKALPPGTVYKTPDGKTFKR